MIGYLGAITGCLIAFGLAPLAVYGLAARIFRPASGDHLRLLLVVGGLGPAALTWLLWLGLALAPGQPGALYPAITTLPCLALLWATREALAPLRRDVTVMLGTRLRRRLAAGLLLLLIVVVGYLVTVPMMAHDPLQYVSVAQIIFRDLSLAGYPPNPADPELGVFVAATHPPGHLMHLLWTFLWQGDREGIAFLRLFSVFYWLAQSASLWALLRPRGPLVALLGALGVFCAPLYVETVLIAHIDPYRIYTLWTAVVLAAWAARQWNPAALAFAGAAIGLAMFSHSIGIVALPFAAAAYFLVTPGAFWRVAFGRRLAGVILLTVAALAIGGWQYLENTINTGFPVGDTASIWELAELNYDDQLRELRDLSGLWELIVLGALRLFVADNYFGLIFWILPVLLPFTWRRFAEDRVGLSSLIFIGLFYLLVAATLAVDSVLIVKNNRYLLTLAPFFAYSGILAILFAWQRLGAGFGSFKPPDRVMALLDRLPVQLPEFRIMAQGAFAVAVVAVFFTSLAATRERLSSYRHFLAPIATLAGDPFRAIADDPRTFGPTISFARKHLAGNALPLVYRQPEFSVYAWHPSIRAIDPTLADFYRSRDAAGAIKRLRRLGIDHVITPRNYLPLTLGNSAMEELVADPHYSELLYQDNRNQVFRLHDSPVRVRCEPVPGFDSGWTTDLLQNGDDTNIIWDHNADGETVRRLIWDEDGRIRVMSQAVEMAPIREHLPPELAARPLVLRLTSAVRGDGWVRVDQLNYTDAGYELEERPVWQGRVISSERAIDLQFIVPPSAAIIRFALRNDGSIRGDVELRAFRLCVIHPAEGDGAGTALKQ
ncbi:hypothetical protein [Oceanibacterium hippocampi]|uniref:Glycosyltransferase RgtA/B/C/D-like domain-containing protein n=1 Tax=Oceanibacterium hippocampi TaxID=745714 RepID=A0A1Y5RUB7_9PROT|nr:hypothetical protein [Oceanibacterium hippocampi]SLN22809.1 hypothetical protein OCH7691_00612 [Oceanibacterium hippocampi]